VAVPVATPVTTPVVETTDAIEPSALLHVPPLVAHVRVVVKPWHTDAVPPIDAGVKLTVNVAVLRQPLLIRYEIVVVPELKPVATPVPASMIALVTLLLTQVPPPVALASVVVAPGQIANVPVIDDTAGFTVIAVIP
jgi:hypothetical protein